MLLRSSSSTLLALAACLAAGCASMGPTEIVRMARGDRIAVPARELVSYRCDGGNLVCKGPPGRLATRECACR